MAIQNRQGAYKDFRPEKMVSGEFAVVLSGDPNASSGRSLYVCFGPGIVKRITTYEDFERELQSVTEDIQSAFTEDIQNAIALSVTATNAANKATEAAEAAAAAATEAAEAAGAYVLGDISDKTVTFSQATALANVQSGDSMATALGKLSKLYAELEGGNMDYWSLRGGIEIPADADLNNYVSVGNYYCSLGEIDIVTLLNCPAVEAFTMKVFYGAGNTVHVSQQIQEYFTGKVYYRKKNVSSGVWTNWKLLTPDISKTWLLEGGIEIPANANLNNYTEIGNYYCLSDATAITLLNCPIRYSFTMKVFYSNGSSSHIGQQIQEYDSGALFFRKKTVSSGTWTSWKLLSPTLANSLTTTGNGYALDAKQGKILNDKITELNGNLNGHIKSFYVGSGNNGGSHETVIDLSDLQEGKAYFVLCAFGHIESKLPLLMYGLFWNHSSRYKTFYLYELQKYASFSYSYEFDISTSTLRITIASDSGAGAPGTIIFIG